MLALVDVDGPAAPPLPLPTPTGPAEAVAVAVLLLSDLVAGARTGVGAGVSVGIVAGEELGEAIVTSSSTDSFCKAVIVFEGAGSVAGESSTVDCEASSCVVVGASVGAFPRPRPRPLPRGAPPRAALGGILIDYAIFEALRLYNVICYRCIERESVVNVENANSASILVIDSEVSDKAGTFLVGDKCCLEQLFNSQPSGPLFYGPCQVPKYQEYQLRTSSSFW